MHMRGVIEFDSDLDAGDAAAKDEVDMAFAQ